MMLNSLKVFSKSRCLLFLLEALLVSHAYAGSESAFYAGLGGGYGSTTWSGLVPVVAKQNSTILISTPRWVNEGGTVLGFFGGYEFTPYFAIEGAYWHYPKASIHFMEDSLFSFEHNERTCFHSETDTLNVLAKIMLTVPKTALRLYSGIGVGRIHRKDEIVEEERMAPAFGAGFIYPLTEHIIGHAGFNYTAGYGESELNPAKSFIPFLYSGFLGLSFRF